MTNKEAAKIIETLKPWSISSDPDDYVNAIEVVNMGISTAIDLAVSALTPWKRLSEETPRKEGVYWIYTPIYGKDSDLSIRKAWWNGRLHGFRIAKQGVYSTHWAEIVGPEDTE